MACCIVIGLLIATVRRAWFALLPSRAPVEPGFAPPARRPAPGVPAAPAPAERQSRPTPRDGDDTRRPGTPLIAAGAAWLLGTEVAAHVLHLLPHSDLLHAPGPLAIATGLALRGGLRLPRPFPRPLPTR